MQHIVFHISFQFFLRRAQFFTGHHFAIIVFFFSNWNIQFRTYCYHEQRVPIFSRRPAFHHVQCYNSLKFYLWPVLKVSECTFADIHADRNTTGFQTFFTTVRAQRTSCMQRKTAVNIRCS